jgi:hypothetical protein
LYLTSLLDGGTDLGPITINDVYEIIDGRHRIAAHIDLGREKIRAVIEGNGDIFLLAKKALQSNLGGPLPNTKDDIRHTITHFIESGESHAKIVNGFSDLFPRGMIEALYREGLSKVQRKKTLQAIALINKGGVDKAKAAEMVGIKEQFVSAELAKRSGNVEISPDKWIVDEKGLMKRRYSHLNMCNGQSISKVLKAFEDGELSASQVNSFMEYASKMLENEKQLVADHLRRWRAQRPPELLRVDLEEVKKIIGDTIKIKRPERHR